MLIIQSFSSIDYNDSRLESPIVDNALEMRLIFTKIKKNPDWPTLPANPGLGDDKQIIFKVQPNKNLFYYKTYLLQQIQEDFWGQMLFYRYTFNIGIYLKHL